MQSNEQFNGPVAGRAKTASLASALRALAADTQALLLATSTYTGDQVTQVRARADESLAAALAQVADTQHAAGARARSAAHATDAFVRSHRWEVLAASAAVGFMLGALLVRQRTPRS